MSRISQTYRNCYFYSVSLDNLRTLWKIINWARKLFLHIRHSNRLSILPFADPAMKPFAVFFTYNLPSTGYIRLPVPDMLQGMSGRASYFDNSTALVKQNSCESQLSIYWLVGAIIFAVSDRAQYVVLVYRTNNPISIGNPNQQTLPGQISAG